MNFNYDANQSNIDRMIEVQRKKISHYKMLNTIYKKKSYSLFKEERQVDKERSLRINNQLMDKQRKWRQTQKQINYENTLLRNKLMQIYIPKQKEANQTLRTNKSLQSLNDDHNYGLNFGVISQNKQSRSKISTLLSHSPMNSRKKSQQKQLNQTNAKFFTKLTSIQSDLMPKLKLRQHHVQTNYFKEMLMKKSPQKNLRMKRFVEKTLYQRPKIHLPVSHSYRQSSNHDLMNPEDQFVFY